MIRVSPAEEPSDFDARVRVPGRRALDELIGLPSNPPRPGPKRKLLAETVEGIPVDALPPEWTKALPALRSAYRDVCAYLGMRIHPSSGWATVDHFIPKSRDRRLAYEWSNFRLATGRMNANKGDATDVLDPFGIHDGWFVLDLGTFAVVPGAGLDDATRARVRATIDRLDLNDGTYRASRAEFYGLYFGLVPDAHGASEPLPWSWLVAECPFVARELERQGRLRETTNPR